MNELMILGVTAVLLGLALLIMGGVGHSNVTVNLQEGKILGQAWFLILIIGFVLILINAYIT